VINHAGFPAPVGGFTPISHPKHKRYYLSRMQRRRKDAHFPLHCIIDTQEGQRCEQADGQLVVTGKSEGPFWT
jgi:hypothetical protein